MTRFALVCRVAAMQFEATSSDDLRALRRQAILNVLPVGASELYNLLDEVEVLHEAIVSVTEAQRK